MPTVNMTVTKTELVDAQTGQITATSVNGNIQGTVVLRCGKAIVKSVDPGDVLRMEFTKA